MWPTDCCRWQLSSLMVWACWGPGSMPLVEQSEETRVRADKVFNNNNRCQEHSNNKHSREDFKEVSKVRKWIFVMAQFFASAPAFKTCKQDCLHPLYLQEGSKAHPQEAAGDSPLHQPAQHLREGQDDVRISRTVLSSWSTSMFSEVLYVSSHCSCLESAVLIIREWFSSVFCIGRSKCLQSTIKIKDYFELLF